VTGTIEQAAATVDAPRNAPGPDAARVLVVFDSTRAGAAALRAGAELAGAGSELSVVTLAPQAKPLRCCGGGGAGPYNCAVRAQADEDLKEARKLLESELKRSAFTVLVGHPDPPLAAWVSEHGFDVVLLPSRRLTRSGGRLARDLRRETAAEVRLVP
jgi:nucleotide-binding universal stress UspA family protein